MTAMLSTSPSVVPAAKVYRVEVHPRAGEPDPVAEAALAEARRTLGGVESARSARVYLIQAALDDAAAGRIANELLADPVTQTAVIGASPVKAGECAIEVHYQAGVMDPVAQSTREAIVEMLPGLNIEEVEVRTGFRYDFGVASGAAGVAEQVRKLAQTALANPVIQDIHNEPFHPERFASAHAYALNVRQVPIRDLDDAALMKMSREAHLFLSLDEMRAVRDYFRTVGREPTDIEVETLAQTWSEHCVHKTLKATITYREPAGGMSGLGKDQIEARPGHTINPDGSLTIHNLLKSTIAAATDALRKDPDGSAGEWCVSVFKDNAGIVRFDDQDAVCIKVETHNHPSAIEPYGGAATGIGGCIRDVMGTGLSAKPIANTDVFAVAFPETTDLPKGVIAPRRTLQQVVGGVRDYGNRMGIPTVNGAVYFHGDYLANPLVFAGCVGLLPLDKCFGETRAGDRIIALGGRTGRDGIHGATFSSAELTDTHADEFAHAVQIGNAITQKKTMDVILQARDHAGGCLYNAITDCGAGGFSSAVGEMGKDLGARVRLEQAPLKYQGLSYTEIWISEAQERMVLAVPPANVPVLEAMCRAEDVEMCDLGEFGCQGDGERAGEAMLALTYHGTEVGRLSMHFMHEGIPTPTRSAEWTGAFALPPTGAIAAGRSGYGGRKSDDAGEILTSLLGHPNIASKHWIIRQYDHEVQGGSVVKPLVGAGQDGPGDAAVLRPKLGSNRGVAIGCGLQPSLAEKTPGGDSYWMALAAIDEAVRNVVCVGADPGYIAILDNFCWPRCDDPRQLGSLVRAAEACYDGAMAYRTPFVSGKDSLSNQFTTEDGKLITIPPTLLITAMGMVNDVTRCRTMDAKAAGNLLLIVGTTTSDLGGSHYLMVTGDDSRNSRIPRVDLKAGPANAKAVAQLIAEGLAASVHDCSDGGLLTAAAEMAFAGRVGLDVNLDALPTERELDDLTACFAETPSRYLVEVSPNQLDAAVAVLKKAGVAFGQVGLFERHQLLTVRCARHGRLMEKPLDALREAWIKPLDW